jgi:TetR/AcrR family transcriptional regulator, mexJK operon transcriptional repressor
VSAKRMTEQATVERVFRRGPGGRPSRIEAERRHKALLQTAAALFLEQGLRGTSVDAIAQAAGVAKRFIYARYADKGELFAAAIESLIQDRTSALYALEITDESAEDALLKLARALIELALKPETIAFTRMLIMEAPRFPALAKLDSERNRHRALGAIVRVLQAYAERGEIVLGDAEMQAELFAILILRGAQHRALIFGVEDPAHLERRTRAAVRLFLNGCRPR